MEVIFHELRARQRPFRFLSPITTVIQPAVFVLMAIPGSHHKQSDRRPIANTRGYTFQVVVEPA